MVWSVSADVDGTLPSQVFFTSNHSIDQDSKLLQKPVFFHEPISFPGQLPSGPEDKIKKQILVKFSHVERKNFIHAVKLGDKELFKDYRPFYTINLLLDTEILPI